MKPVTAALLSFTALASGASFAQTVAESHSGLSAALNVNFSTVAVNASDSIGNSFGKVNASDQNLLIQVSKGLPIGSNGVANFGFSTNLGDIKSGSLGALQLKATGSSAVYAELGYAFDTRSMAYGKLSLNQLTATLSGGGPGVDGTLSANGTGFGAGYRHGLSHGVYIQCEFMQINYGDVIASGGLIFKPSSTSTMVGLGVKF